MNHTTLKLRMTRKLQLMAVLMMFGIVTSTEGIFAGGKPTPSGSASKGSKSQNSSSDYDKMSLEKLELLKKAHNEKVKKAPKSELKNLHSEAIEIAKALNKKQKNKKATNVQSAKTAATKAKTAQADKEAGDTIGGGVNKAAVKSAAQSKATADLEVAQSKVADVKADKANHTQGENKPTTATPGADTANVVVTPMNL